MSRTHAERDYEDDAAYGHQIDQKQDVGVAWRPAAVAPSGVDDVKGVRPVHWWHGQGHM